MHCLAERERLDLRARSGELIRTESADLIVTSILRSLRDNLRGLPVQLMHPLQGMTDLLQICQTLKAGIDGVLHKTARGGDISARLRRQLKRHHQVIERERNGDDE
jgi:DNA-binding response OmpR family regulator